MGAAASSGPPQALVDQLAPGGRMLIPVGDYPQQFIQVDKLPSGELNRRRLADVKDFYLYFLTCFGQFSQVLFVPLTNKTHQLGGSEL